MACQYLMETAIYPPSLPSMSLLTCFRSIVARLCVLPLLRLFVGPLSGCDCQISSYLAHSPSKPLMRLTH